MKNKFLFLVLLSILFLPFKVGALANPVTGGMNYFIYNIDENSPTKNGTQAFATTGSTTVYPFTSYTNNYFGFGYKTVQFTTTSPSGTKSALGYTITATFQILFDGLQNNMGNTSYTGWVKFNDGMVANEVSSVELIALTSGSATFKITTTAQLTNTTSLNGMTISLTAAKTLGFAGYGDKFTVQLVLQDVVVQYAENENSAILNSLNRNQQETNKKLDEVKEEIKKQTEEQKKNNEELKKTNDFIMDDTEPNSDISSLGNVQGLLPPGPVDSLLNIPFKFLSVIVSSLGELCVPLSGKFVFNSTLTLPCFTPLFYDKVPSSLMIFINLIPSAFILINYLKHLYKKVDRAVSMETNADDEWGVL